MQPTTKVVGAILIVVALIVATCVLSEPKPKMTPMYSEGAWVKLSNGTQGYIRTVWPSKDSVSYGFRYKVASGEILNIYVEQWEIGERVRDGD